jgi:hypothetical protein
VQRRGEPGQVLRSLLVLESHGGRDHVLPPWVRRRGACSWRRGGRSCLSL